MLKVLPIALALASLSLFAGLARKNQWLPPWALASIKHPYAAQVFGIVVGYLLIMRLNACLNRWDKGMDYLEAMEAQWSDAYAQTVTFIELEISRAEEKHDQPNLELLNYSKCLLIHIFSLLNVLAITTLTQCTGELYGRVSKTGRENIFNVKCIPWAIRDDGSGMVDFHRTLTHMKQEDANNYFANKEGWIKRVLVIGEMTEKELETLHHSSRQAHLVYHWALEFMTFLYGYGVVTMPPPIYSRCYQELSNGMLGFVHALKTASIPFPQIVTQLSYVLLLMTMVFMPFLIEKFTQSIVFTFFLTLGTEFGMLMIHVIAVELEMPYGEDFMDLPLLELHTAFNRLLLLPYVSPDSDGHAVLDPFLCAYKLMKEKRSLLASPEEAPKPRGAPAAAKAENNGEAVGLQQRLEALRAGLHAEIADLKELVSLKRQLASESASLGFEGARALEAPARLPEPPSETTPAPVDADGMSDLRSSLRKTLNKKRPKSAAKGLKSSARVAPSS